MEVEATEFYLAGNKHGVLLVHGYTGSPAELRELGEKLHQADNYTVRGLLLPGHDGTVEGLTDISWPSCIAAIEEAVLELQQQCTEVIVVGMCAGSLLTMLALDKVTIDGLVLLSVPVYLYDITEPIKKVGAAVCSVGENNGPREDYDVAVNFVGTEIFDKFQQLIAVCTPERLAGIQTPCLFLQSNTEKFIQPSSAEYVYEHIGSTQKKIIWLDSKHVLTMFDKKDFVLAAVQGFIQDIIRSKQMTELDYEQIFTKILAAEGEQAFLTEAAWRAAAARQQIPESLVEQILAEVGPLPTNAADACPAPTHIIYHYRQLELQEEH